MWDENKKSSHSFKTIEFMWYLRKPPPCVFPGFWEWLSHENGPTQPTIQLLPAKRFADPFKESRLVIGDFFSNLFRVFLEQFAGAF
jgi:hypothetical protein